MREDRDGWLGQGHGGGALNLHSNAAPRSTRILSAKRLANAAGGETNKPAVRFGNVSILPAPIEIEEIGRERDYYSIDMHSRTGFSGSPVFVYRSIGSDLTGEDLKKLYQMVKSHALRSSDPPFWDFRPYMGLLGSHCAQFPEELEIKRKKNHAAKKPADIPRVAFEGRTQEPEPTPVLHSRPLPKGPS